MDQQSYQPDSQPAQSELKVFVAGHTGMVGRAVLRRLHQSSSLEPLQSDERIDYTLPNSAERVLQKYQPDAVVLCAAKVGGIHANNTYRADFIRENLAIQLNWIEAAHKYGLKKFILLGSSCIYPRDALQPMIEESLLTGSYEPTNQPYALAKTAGIELCNAYHHQYGDNFYSLMPPNQYGPYDNFRVGESHVVASLLRKAYEAVDGSVIELWGTGSPKREFMHVDDLADAITFCLKRVDVSDCEPNGFLNVGTREECTIRQLAELIVETSGKRLTLTFDPAMPDGPPRKVMDSTRLKQLGWQHRISLDEGIRSTWRWLEPNWQQPTVRK